MTQVEQICPASGKAKRLPSPLMTVTSLLAACYFWTDLQSQNVEIHVLCNRGKCSEVSETTAREAEEGHIINVHTSSPWISPNVPGNSGANWKDRTANQN